MDDYKTLISYYVAVSKHRVEARNVARLVLQLLLDSGNRKLEPEEKAKGVMRKMYLDLEKLLSELDVPAPTVPVPPTPALASTYASTLAAVVAAIPHPFDNNKAFADHTLVSGSEMYKCVSENLMEMFEVLYTAAALLGVDKGEEDGSVKGMGMGTTGVGKGYEVVS